MRCQPWDVGTSVKNATINDLKMEIKVYRSSKVQKCYCLIDAAFANIKPGAPQGAYIFLCTNKKIFKVHSLLKHLP